MSRLPANQRVRTPTSKLGITIRSMFGERKELIDLLLKRWFWTKRKIYRFALKGVVSDDSSKTRNESFDRLLIKYYYIYSTFDEKKNLSIHS